MKGENRLLALVETPDDDSYRLQDQVGFILRKAHQRHVAIFASIIDDLTPPQFAALAMLAKVGETSQNQLGQMIAMDGATAKGVVDRLSARGFVTVRRDENDKRRLLLNLSAEGRDAYDRLHPLAQQITAATLSPLSARDAQQLIKLLSKIS